MLTLIGLLTIAALVALLITGRTTAIIALVLVPLVAALIVGTGTDALAGYFNDGLRRVAPIDHLLRGAAGCGAVPPPG